MAHLLDEIRTNPGTVKGPPCSLGAALDDLDTVDRDDLVAALDDRSISARAISDALQRRQYPVGIGAVQRHRRGECLCGRAA